MLHSARPAIRSLILRLRTEFKKGYPHGPARLEVMKENATEPMWVGHFTNGVVSDDTMDTTIRNGHSL